VRSDWASSRRPTYYEDDFDTSAALCELAHGFEDPVREMEASVGRLHMRALELDHERNT